MVIKPCPFCNKKRTLTITKKDFFDSSVAKGLEPAIHIGCWKCGLELWDFSSSIDYNERLNILISRWNELFIIKEDIEDDGR